MEENQNFQHLKGLVAATFTPFDSNGNLNLDLVPNLVNHLANCSIKALFINGTTGEGPSLTEEERLTIAETYTSAAKSHGMTSIIHVGHETLPVAGRLAAHVPCPQGHRPPYSERLVLW